MTPPACGRRFERAHDDPRVARAIEATGRRKLIFAGLSLEVCAAFPAITAVGKGLDAYVAVDACGMFSDTWFAVRHPRWEPYAGKPHVRFLQASGGLAADDASWRHSLRLRDAHD